MEKRLTTYLILFFGLLMVSCAAEDTCEDDIKDGAWDKVINNSACSAEQKGEAYLGRGGFDYFKFFDKNITKLIDVLGLNLQNVESKWQDFENAANAVENSYNGGSDAEKTIFFLGSFLAFYTKVMWKLDNGAGGTAEAFDENPSSEEIDYFTGTQTSGEATDDAKMVPSDYLQIKFNDKTTYYIFLVDASGDISLDVNNIFKDISADGFISMDETSDSVMTYFDLLDITADISTSNFEKINKVIYMEDMTDPFDGKNIGDVVTFAEDLANYLADIEKAMIALGIDPTDDTIETIRKYRRKLDNGGQCTTLEENPSIGFLELLVEKLQKAEIKAGQDAYAGKNIISAVESKDKMVTKVDTSYDGIDLGMKILFRKKDTTSDYIPYWEGATTNIYNAMDSISLFNPGDVTTDDKNIALTEILCAPDAFSSNE